MPSMTEPISAAVVRRRKSLVARTKQPRQGKSGLEEAAFLRSSGWAGFAEPPTKSFSPQAPKSFLSGSQNSIAVGHTIISQPVGTCISGV
eukprot:598489-Prymnesium_polylepis.1